jgi:hypothetical protein
MALRLLADPILAGDHNTLILRQSRNDRSFPFWETFSFSSQ